MIWDFLICFDTLGTILEHLICVGTTSSILKIGTISNILIFLIRRMAENGFAPPLGNFADISYLVEN